MRLRKIISGGQTGADQAGLRAAKLLGLETGGWAPSGFRTLDGPAPWLGTLYGLREALTPFYALRTEFNVRDADATVRFALDFNSPGERCTLKAVVKHRKPVIDIPIVRVPIVMLGIESGNVGLFRAFVEANNVQVLNVAGNAERTAPGIGDVVANFLVQACRM